MAYLIPDCGLKTVTPLSQALQSSGLEQFHVENLPEAPSRHPRLGKQSLPRGWASGFISPASCSPFSLHLIIPWRWPGVQPAPNPIFPRRSPSSAPQSPALTAPRKLLPGHSFTEKLRGASENSAGAVLACVQTTHRTVPRRAPGNPECKRDCCLPTAPTPPTSPRPVLWVAVTQDHTGGFSNSLHPYTSSFDMHLIRVSRGRVGVGEWD